MSSSLAVDFVFVFPSIVKSTGFQQEIALSIPGCELSAEDNEVRLLFEGNYKDVKKALAVVCCHDGKLRRVISPSRAVEVEILAIAKGLNLGGKPVVGKPPKRRATVGALAHAGVDRLMGSRFGRYLDYRVLLVVAAVSMLLGAERLHFAFKRLNPNLTTIVETRTSGGNVISSSTVNHRAANKRRDELQTRNTILGALFLFAGMSAFLLGVYSWSSESE